MRFRASLALPLLAAAPAAYDATGWASWYGEEVAGRTAAGHRFDAGRIAAAHRTLPLGTIVEVTALETGRAALVPIEDRGPSMPDRLIDLSRAAAQVVGTDRAPLSRVRVRTVMASEDQIAAVRAGRAVVTAEGHAPPARTAPDPARRYVVQIASFADRARAAALAERLGARLERGPGVWRVRLGPLDAAAAQRARDAGVARGYGDAILLPFDRPDGILP